jgi:hypothetical protein
MPGTPRGGGFALRLVAGIVVLAAAIVALRYLLAPEPSPAAPGRSAKAGDAELRSSPWQAGPAGAPASAPARQAPATGVAPAAPMQAVTRDLAVSAMRGDAAAAERLSRAMEAGDPRAYAYAALYCVPGTGCDPSPGDRAVALAASQVRAGLAIRSGDPEAVYHAGLAIAQRGLGRNPLRGAAWMLVACRRGYDCASPGELDRAWPCGAADAACGATTTVEDRLQTLMGAAGFAQAFTLADEFGAMLDAGDVPESVVAYGGG